MLQCLDCVLGPVVHSSFCQRQLLVPHEWLQRTNLLDHRKSFWRGFSILRKLIPCYWYFVRFWHGRARHSWAQRICLSTPMILWKSHHVFVFRLLLGIRSCHTLCRKCWRSLRY